MSCYHGREKQFEMSAGLEKEPEQRHYTIYTLCYLLLFASWHWDSNMQQHGSVFDDHGHTNAGTVVSRLSTGWKLCCATYYAVRCNMFCMPTFVRREIADDGVSHAKTVS